MRCRLLEGQEAYTSATSGSRSKSSGTRRSASRMPPRREQSESIWSKVFSKGQDEFKGWHALRRFASRSKSQARDVEMQRVQPVGNTLQQPGDWTDAIWNPAARPTLHSGIGRIRRLQRPEHLRTNRSRTGGWRAEAERQRLRDAWGRSEVRPRESFQVYEPQPLALQRRPDSPAIPEPVAQPERGASQ